MNVIDMTDEQQRRQIIADLWKEAFITAIERGRSDEASIELADLAEVKYEEMLDRRRLAAEKAEQAEKVKLQNSRTLKGKPFQTQ